MKYNQGNRLSCPPALNRLIDPRIETLVTFHKRAQEAYFLRHNGLSSGSEPPRERQIVAQKEKTRLIHYQQILSRTACFAPTIEQRLHVLFSDR